MSSPRKKSPPVHLFDLMESLPALSPGSGVLGEGDNREPLVLNLMDSKTAHVLISGEHAAGKTALLRAFGTSLALMSRQAELQLVLIDTDLAGGNDPRGSLQTVSFLPHNLAEMIIHVEDAVAVLGFLVEEMAYRMEQTISLPHIAIIIDHLLPLLVEGGNLVEESLRTLIRQGERAAMHLVVATRRAEGEMLEAILAESWPVRIVGPQPAEAGNGYAPTHGEFDAHFGQKKVPFRAAIVEDYDLELCLEDLRRYRPPSLIAQPLPPAPRHGASVA